MSDIEKIKEIRNRTGIGIADCKRALIASEWDVDAAIEYIRKESAIKAGKKADRTASEGRVFASISDDKKTAAIIEVNAETDFAAKSDRFEDFLENVAATTLSHGEKSIEMHEKARQELIQAIGENINIRRVRKINTDDGFFTAYVHSNGKLGCIVEMNADAGDDVAKDMALHITAMAPMVVSIEDLPAEAVEKERAILTEQAIASGKPEKIVDQIVSGRMRNFHAEACLIEQGFVKEPKTPVKKLLADASAVCSSFVRFQVGEDLG